MKTQIDTDYLVIENLKKSALTLSQVLDQDTKKVLEGNKDAIADINVNLRTLAAINEVLLYYGDAGVFGDDL